MNLPEIILQIERALAAPGASILECTAAAFGLRINDLTGPRRFKTSTQARHVAMYLTRKHSDHSLTEIGAAFGRGHDTVIHALHRINEQLSNQLGKHVPIYPIAA